MSLAQVTTVAVNSHTGQALRICDQDSQTIRVKLARMSLCPELRLAYTAELALREARADIELREEVIEALMAEGKARHVAENLTNTEAKMIEQGRRVGIL